MLMRFRNLLLAAATLCSASAFAAEVKTVNVPFSFIANHHVFAPGTYTIAVDWSRSRVTLKNVQTTGLPLTWIMSPADITDPLRVSLTFDVAGTDHVLQTIRYDTYATSNLDRQVKHSVERTATVGE